MGAPGTVEYRFANGWRWYGLLSNPAAVGPLLTDSSPEPGLTFEIAAKLARDASHNVANEGPDVPPASPSAVNGSGDAEGRIAQVLAKEQVFLMLAPISADDFASCVRVCGRELQSILQSEPGLAQQPATIQKVSEFWKKAAAAVVDGYRSDCQKARLARQAGGNRRFLEVALGAAIADYESTKSEPANWGEDFSFPFPRSDGFETEAGSPRSLSATNYYWEKFPQALLEQSAAASILPRALRISLPDPTASPAAGSEASGAMQLVLVPDVPGLVRFQQNATNYSDQPWQPDTPFYMAVGETSFGQMRLYARWAEQQLVRHPEQAGWFVRVPATKQLVGAQNQPYTGVTLDEAASFCNWLSFAHGREPAYSRLQDGTWVLDHTKDGFRLPEAKEWEYAARFGFDFLATPGTPRWTNIETQINQPGKQADRRLVCFSTASQAGASARAVDDAGAWLYPLGLRDLCGNAGELCLADTTTADISRWVVCGGNYTSLWEGAVMPWFQTDFSGRANAETGFRVVLPVPLDNFLKD
jgi:formylglycine-generating enzyme required for sulfatase activity